MSSAKKPLSKRASKLVRIVDRLRTHYTRVEPPPAVTPFALILWEKVAYLASDAKRRAAFDALASRVGLTPDAILAAKPAELQSISALGGSVGIVERAAGMQDAAALVIEQFGGSLDTVLTLPLAAAKRELRRFHGVGEPGAERILLLHRAHRVLSLDSNGARTMVRLGYGADDKNYTRMYRSVAESARRELIDDFDWLIDAHVLLRHHGQETCKTSAPRCEACVVRDDCAYAVARRPP